MPGRGIAAAQRRPANAPSALPPPRPFRKARWLALLPVLLLTAALPAAPGLAAAPSPVQDRTIHVFVALCDNLHQGIAPVPPALGNGADPRGNLYWGAMYGLKTYFMKQPDWTLLRREDNPSPLILERLVFKYRGGGRPDAGGAIYLVADAYNGKNIKECIDHFLLAAAGGAWPEIKLQKPSPRLIPAGGASSLLCFVGHNGLMEFHLFGYHRMNPGRRAAAVFACRSKPYFSRLLSLAGAEPLLLTNGNLAPEGYAVHALASAWARGESGEEIREAVARAYHKYQKCGLNGARRLFAL